MISQLPKWIEIGAFALALCAGFVNAVGLLSFEHQSVSHVTGTATILGTHLYNFADPGKWHLLGVLVSFLSGSTIAGLILHGDALKLGKHYDNALLLEAFLLLAALILLNDELMFGHYLASAACGLQNALATKYSGAVIRTTHLTGIFTDLGIMIGSYLRGERLDKRNAKLFLLIIAGFVFGGTIGACAFAAYRFYALLFPASFCITLALAYRKYSKAHLGMGRQQH